MAEETAQPTAAAPPADPQAQTATTPPAVVNADKGVVQSISLLIPIQVRVPGTVEEYNTAAGDPEAVLEHAIRFHIYRKPAGEFRSKFLKELEKALGIPRKVKEKKPDDKSDKHPGYAETEQEFYKRALAETATARSTEEQPVTVEEIAASLKPFAQSIADQINWFPAASTGGTIAQSWLNGAADVKAQIDSKPDLIEIVLANLAPTGVEIKVENNVVDQESLARAMKAEQELLQKAQGSRLLQTA